MRSRYLCDGRFRVEEMIRGDSILISVFGFVECVGLKLLIKVKFGD